ncbi:hypothetical protein K491DRAFT_271382 [Lophiostoma macrostomum CBS 122681]|uniref:Uncharacterized protein n=1 Tax=Lophiostoma macrostomum CBS 122681 TaxID=1314788 RepID=A0A6A6SJL7_9PLEO|nr:hypothetical protein K491DRAFT_271382 [Lophiostoma macrostomum CBS 122681]
MLPAARAITYDLSYVFTYPLAVSCVSCRRVPVAACLCLTRYLNYSRRTKPPRLNGFATSLTGTVSASLPQFLQFVKRAVDLELRPCTLFFPKTFVWRLSSACAA